MAESGKYLLALLRGVLRAADGGGADVGESDGMPTVAEGTECDAAGVGAHGAEPGIPGDAWESLYTLCREQNLIGFLHRAAAGDANVPEAVRAKIQRQYLLSVAQQVQQDYYREQIFSALAAAGIRYLPLKGEDLRAVYPAADLRFSCDIDFFYDAPRRNEVNAILAGMGFSRERGDAHNDSFMLGAVHVEPHFDLTDSGKRHKAYYANVWDRLVSDDGIRYRFTDEDFYIFVLLHTYKHFLAGGSGARSVMDAWLWKKAHPAMDETILASAYDELGITRFALQLERLGRVWFGGEKSDEDMGLLTVFLLSGGAYGTKQQAASMDAAKAGKTRGARFRYLWQRVFLPYKLLRLQYPVLRRAPVLLPFFWVVRWFRLLFSRDRDHLKSTLYAAGKMTKEETEEVRRVWEIIR